MNRVIFWVVVVLGTVCLAVGAAGWFVVVDVKEHPLQSPTVVRSAPIATQVLAEDSTSVSPKPEAIKERPAPVATKAKTEKSASKKD
jgi:hypothetical protein